MENNLPENWKLIPISKLRLTLFKGVNVALKSNSGKYLFIPSGANFPDGIKIQKAKWISDNELKKIPKEKLLQKGDILFNSGGVGTLGRSSYYSNDNKPTVCDSFIIVIRDELKQTNMKHLFYWFQSAKADELIKANTKGTTGITSIKSSDLESFEISLPPFAEQHRIVAKLDAVMQKVESNKLRLDKIPKLLKRFRQSVLAAAVSGKLTEDWREKNPNIESAAELIQRIEIKRTKTNLKLTKTFLNDYYYEVELPVNWKQCRIGQIHDDLTDYHANGSYEILKKNVELINHSDFAMMIRATNFEKNNFDTLMLYINEHSYNFLKKSKLFGGEIIIGKIGNAGKIYYMPKLNRPCSLAMNLFALKFNLEFIEGKFIYYYLSSMYGEMDIKNYIKGVGNITIDKISIRSLLINLPPLEEQKEIVRRVEQLFAFADKIEARYTKAKAMLDKLPQSILAKAFRGELVPQNPNDEPASVLLARIKAEKDKLAKEKKEKKSNL